MPEDVKVSPAGQIARKSAVSHAEREAEEAQEKQRRKQRLQQRTLLSDCTLMLRYALDESLRLPQELTKNIATADVLLKGKDQDPLSDIPRELVEDSPPGGPPDKSIDDILLEVHNALSDLVAPATPVSLRATDPELVWLGMPMVVKLAVVGAVIFAAVFVIFVPKPQWQTSGETPKTTASSPQPTPSRSP
jgi:hypothetical protein